MPEVKFLSMDVRLSLTVEGRDANAATELVKAGTRVTFVVHEATVLVASGAATELEISGMVLEVIAP